MIVVFAGPSLHGFDRSACPGIEFRPPAGFGDVARAAREGASVIGLVDGVFEQQRSVWHKEILFALEAGARVEGAASLGALRAVECETYGMVGVGEIFAEYRDGRRYLDADVAVTHGPAELGFVPLSLSQVDVEHTLDRLHDLGLVSAAESAGIRAASRAVFFKNRTFATLATACRHLTRPDLAEALRAHWVDRKGADARLLLDRITA